MPIKPEHLDELLSGYEKRKDDTFSRDDFACDARAALAARS